MQPDPYLDLKNEHEDTMAYNMRLGDFAIANGIDSPSNVAYVAHQIIERKLVDKFKQYQHITRTQEEREKDEEG